MRSSSMDLNGRYEIPAHNPSKAYEISVVAPCFNEEHNVGLLVERLQRIFKKKNLKGEIILVDDASTDGTRAAIMALQKAWPNVAIVTHDRNQGIAAGWN